MTYGEIRDASLMLIGQYTIAGTGSYNSLYLPLQSTLPHHPGEKTGIDLLPTQHSPEHLCRGGSTIRVHVFPLK